jgi:hypothetical protein
MDFAQAVERWHDFYFALAGISATLVGLLFVVVSLKREVLRNPRFADLTNMVELTFNNFLALTLFALLFLVPGQTPPGISFPVILIGVVMLVSNFREIRDANRHAEHPIRQILMPGRLIIPQISVLSALAYGFWILTSLFILNGQTDALNWLAVPALLLLASATQTAWSFLIQPRDQSIHLPVDASDTKTPRHKRDYRSGFSAHNQDVVRLEGGVGRPGALRFQPVRDGGGGLRQHHLQALNYVRRTPLPLRPGHEFAGRFGEFPGALHFQPGVEEHAAPLVVGVTAHVAGVAQPFE